MFLNPGDSNSVVRESVFLTTQKTDLGISTFVHAIILYWLWKLVTGIHTIDFLSCFSENKPYFICLLRGLENKKARKPKGLQGHPSAPTISVSKWAGLLEVTDHRHLLPRWFKVLKLMEKSPVWIQGGLQMRFYSDLGRIESSTGLNSTCWDYGLVTIIIF